jgi:hypothetical protein
MNKVEFKKGKVSSREAVCLLKTSRDLQMLFAAMAHFDKGLTLETLLTLRVEKSLICLVDTRRPTASIIEETFILILKMLARNKTSRCCHLE